MTNDVSNIARLWALYIANGEIPTPFSPRDGRFLRLVPRAERLDSTLTHLRTVFETDEHQFLECCSILENLPPGKSRSRAELGWARSLAYLRAGNATQALRASEFRQYEQYPANPPARITGTMTNQTSN